MVSAYRGVDRWFYGHQFCGVFLELLVMPGATPVCQRCGAPLLRWHVTDGHAIALLPSWIRDRCIELTEEIMLYAPAAPD